ncbi:MAG: prepilin-type N-terminal cleavage/methylation domain-containing protein [Candidatus Falkowbacteria bacterium]
MKNKKAFTLIELLIVIAIIAIIAGIVFVALNPLARFAAARTSRRWADASAVLTAIKVNQIDNGGAYCTSITAMQNGIVYMIGTSTTGAQQTCQTTIGTSSAVDLTALVTGGYLGSVPVSPSGNYTYYNGSTTGYTLTKATSGLITITACDTESTPQPSVSR